VLDVEAARLESERPDLVFAMCQGPDGLALLDGWERSGVRVVNSAAAIAGCRREGMLRAFERHAVTYPESRSIPTGTECALPEWTEGGAWLKRGDVHAIESGDVVFFRGRAEAQQAIDDLRRRGIRSAVVQRHVSGDVVKFYAAPGGFLRCYVSGEEVNDAWTASIDALVRRAAGALGLEVFGGDLVRDRSGAFWLIDLNDWPSFAPCRCAAAAAIVDYLDRQSRLSES
jgi:glutathione synthase/RimK-type ligase-like ATP-grasp enzyme